ncbi:hypothetical protein RQP46_008584 [Phenoliferia psychrophenolica]
MLLPLELSVLSRTILRRTSTLSTSARLSFSTTRALANSLEHPSYAGLFLHPLPSPSKPNTFSVSFLPTPAPSLAFSPTTIGVLKQDPLFPAEGTGPPAILPRNFEENREFVQLLHEVLKGVVGGDLGLDTMAKVRGDGYIHIADERNPADANRVPDPSDIIASVLVQDGAVVPSSYSPSGTHRVVSMDGMMRLPEGLMRSFRDALGKVREVEVGIAKGDE